MGRGHKENDVLSEVFMLVIVNNLHLSSLNLVFCSLCCSIHENRDSGDMPRAQLRSLNAREHLIKA